MSMKAKLLWLILNVYGPISLGMHLLIWFGDLGAAYVNKVTKEKNMYTFLKFECIITVTVCRGKSAPGDFVSYLEI